MERTYELIYVINPTLSEEAHAALTARVENLVSANGKVVNVDDWGKKRLAYEIEDHKEGHYILLTFEANAEAPREIERVMRITDGVLRYLVIRKEG